MPVASNSRDSHLWCVKFAMLNPEVAPGLQRAANRVQGHLCCPVPCHQCWLYQHRLSHQNTAFVKEEGPTPPRWPFANTVLAQTFTEVLFWKSDCKAGFTFFCRAEGSGRRNSPKQNSQREKTLKEEAGCGYRKVYFFKNTSGSYVTLNFSAAAL